MYTAMKNLIPDLSKSGSSCPPQNRSGRQIKFTRHGNERLNERLSLTGGEIKARINANQAIPLGQEKNRTHYLIYSPPDQECFVVVMNHKTLEIITILPIDYHHRWKISLDLVLQAQGLTAPTDTGG